MAFRNRFRTLAGPFHHSHTVTAQVLIHSHLIELINAIEELEGIKYSYPDLKMYMELEFPRAQFYDDMFRKWGLKTGEVWKPGTQAI